MRIRIRIRIRRIVILIILKADGCQGEGSFSSQFLSILLDNMHEQPFLPKQTILQEGKELLKHCGFRV